jgi:hypothetical protein
MHLYEKWLICCGQKKILRHIQRKSLESGTDFTLEEFTKFWGHLCHLSVLEIPEIKMMWSEEGYVIGYPSKEARMGKNRFFAVSGNIAYNHTFVFKCLQTSFQRYMNPGTLVCVDEARIPAKDKSCPFLTYNPNKPHKWALESLTLTLSNKYLWDFTNPAEQDNPTPFQWLHSVWREALVIFSQTYFSYHSRHSFFKCGTS